MNNKQNRILNSIQVLRGIAALSVVLYHYGFYLVPTGGDVNARPFSWGGIGVDLFFVISGFIMVIVTHNSGSGFNATKSFMINRLSRILPVYYVILLFAFFTNGAMSTFHYEEKVQNLISALTFSPYMHETAPMYILADGLFNVRWTLSYELYFYVAFSACLLFSRKLIPLALWFITPVAICFLSIGNITFSTKGYNFDSVFIEFITNPIILEFGMGIVTGLLYLRLSKNGRAPHIIMTTSLVALVITGIGTNILTMYNLLSGFAFSLLVLALSLSEKFFHSQWIRFVVFLGNISFSLYLIHNPLASFMSKKVEKYIPGMMHSALGVTIMLMAAILAACISHKYLEIRLSKFIKSKIESRFINSNPASKVL